MLFIINSSIRSNMHRLIRNSCYVGSFFSPSKATISDCLFVDHQQQHLDRVIHNSLGFLEKKASMTRVCVCL